MFKPVVKGTWLIIRPDSVIDVLNTAYKVATSGRPGPVFVQLPYDIQLAEVEGEIEAPSARGPTLGRARADQDSVRRVAEMIAKAERPLLLAGGGAIRAGAADALRAAVEKLNIPAATTLPAKGYFSEDHPLSLGTLGRSGWASAAEAAREADLVVGVGARFSDNHTANWRKGSIYDVEKTKIVQVDVDGSEIGRNFPVALGLVSDARLFLEDLAAASKGPNAQARGLDQARARLSRRLARRDQVAAGGDDGADPSGTPRARGRAGAARQRHRLHRYRRRHPIRRGLHARSAAPAPGRSAPAWPRWAGPRPA